MKTSICLVILLLLTACGGDRPPASASVAAEPCAVAAVPMSDITPQDIADNNRGVALMGYFDYTQARETFAALVQRQPGWHDACINLAIATLNRQNEGDEQRALDIAAKVLSQDPGHVRANYVSGLLRLYLGETDVAEGHFRQVVEARPDDAYSLYYLGQVLLQGGDVETAVASFRKAMALDPYLRSAYYRAALALRRTGNADESRELLAAYTRMENNPRATLAEFKYTRMGPFAEATAVDVDSPSAKTSIVETWFDEPIVLTTLQPPGKDVSLTTVDIDADGDQDLFLADVAGSQVWLGDEQGFQKHSHPLAGITNVKAVAWGDVDNDGYVDAYLCRDGANQLWRQVAANDWQDVTDTAGVANGKLNCADVALIDADHDIDLDIFVVNRDGPNELFSNNLDGSFRMLATEQGLGGRSGSRQTLATDIDNDRDLDLLVIKDQPPHELFINDRLWQYRTGDIDSEWFTQPVGAVVAADLEATGNTEIIPAQQLRWQVSGDASPQPTDYDSAQLIASDFDGDGFIDLALFDDMALIVYSPHTQQKYSIDEGVVAATTLIQDPARGPAIVVLRTDGKLVLHPAADSRHPFVAMNFSGKEERADSMRSNRDGIGTRIALRVGSRWTLTEHIDPNSSPGQSLQPTAIGLGGSDKADFVALTWPDGVFQTELDIEPGAKPITETQRQLSSCPVLFAWNGTDYGFVTDMLGVGGVGFFVEPGVAATPRPWEYLLLPEGAVVPRDGELIFKITEPMEEIAYIDSVRLHVYDIPADTQMVIDDRMVINGPAATGDAIFFSRELLPLQAFNDRGDEVTATVTARDQVAAPVGDLDKRFIGRLAQPHTLTLDFSEPLDRDGDPVLVIDGWVEYPYSQTVFAAWQAKAGFDAPTLEAFGRDGRWQTIYPQFGYPAGMPRRMALPLRDLPEGTMRLRLTTNLEVYYDRIAVVHAAPADYTAAVLNPATARQRLIGFPKRTNGPQRLPGYDYNARATFWDTRYPRGEYSAFGPVTELVAQTDDAVAVIGPGEEVEVRFTDLRHKPAAGWQRYYVLEVRGWAKDMDLYTYDGGTVGPMPLRSPTSNGAIRDQLHKRYHTRYQSGF